MNIVEEKFAQETKQADIDHHKPTAGAMVGHVLANFKLEEMKLIQAQLYVLGTSSQELSTLFRNMLIKKRDGSIKSLMSW